MQKINEIDELIKLISKLPGLGPKSAKRIVLKLINNRDELIKPITNSLAQVIKIFLDVKFVEFLNLHLSSVISIPVKLLRKNMIKFVLSKISQINGA